MRKISLQEARQIILTAQGLNRRDVFGAGATGVVGAFERLSYVQIDTISVVQRAHHHVLWSRVRDYQASILHSLVGGDRRVFEYWSHAASYLPLRDFRFSLPRKRLYAAREDKAPLRRKVLAQIRERGAQSTRDFESPDRRGQPSGWWEWKPAKRALEQLWMDGTLMIRERRGFDKMYDLTERVLPPGVDTRYPSVREQSAYQIESSLRAQGLMRAGQFAYLRRKPQKDLVLKELRRQLKDGELQEIEVEGLEGTFVARPDVAHEPPGAHARILSPFDNLVIQRARMLELFGLDYTIGCYTPAAKRRFGYFGLPVLIGDEIVGQMDLKADRATRTLIVQSAHLQRLNSVQEELLRVELQEFAAFNGCDRVISAKRRTPRVIEALLR